jgi:hypothetical protein
MPWWFRPLVALVFGIAGYQRATYFERRHGRTPWGWHPLGWAVLTGLSLFVGAVCLAMAERAGRKRAPLSGPGAASTWGQTVTWDDRFGPRPPTGVPESLPTSAPPPSSGFAPPPR